MKKGLLFLLSAVLIIATLAGCGGIDKRIYGMWADESGNNGYGFGTDGKGYMLFQGFTLPVVFNMKDGKLYVLLKEEGDPMTSEDSLTYGVTFFGDDEIFLEYPLDSGEGVKYTRQYSQ